uniref:Mitochondrial splicing suppressor 51-like C-terminal domain-containing protein n=1 Tax=Ananas comosus var. bracteatus TaxID=296719 RepID=A0A6V7NJR1_ANACO|nr:unnamed protein product [Ananas comosus var. bracteatus]
MCSFRTKLFPYALFSCQRDFINEAWTSECSCGPTVASIGGLGIMNEWNLPSSLCHHFCFFITDPKNPISTPLSSWKDYYKWRSLPFHSPVALLLHWPLTIYHCLQLSFARNSSSEVSGKLHIHYLGPEKELLQLAVFGELRALFPGLQLYIELVGPAVPQRRDGETICISNYAHCSEESCHCRSSERTNAVMLRLRKGVQQDSNAHLIVAPNAGVAAYSSWLPTIELIKEMGVPAIFTDFCEEAAFLASRLHKLCNWPPSQPANSDKSFPTAYGVESQASDIDSVGRWTRKRPCLGILNEAMRGSASWRHSAGGGFELSGVGRLVVVTADQ